MIVFLTAPGMDYTHREVADKATGLTVRLQNYRNLLQQTSVACATYIFTDMDRLSLQHLQRVAAAFRAMKAGGLRVLNDPVRIPSRYGLLRLLHEAGMNDFNAYRVEERVRPGRWPVFLRTEGNHDRPLTDLLPDWDATQRAIDEALARGIPLSTLLIVEYAAEPVVGKLYRKLSSFRIGGRICATTNVHEDSWLVKYGKKGIAGADLYEDELRIIEENRYADRLAQAFELAHIEYGRVDYGLVKGRPQIYEINTNPEVKFGGDHPFEQRVRSSNLSKANYLAALAKVDTRRPPTQLPISIVDADNAHHEAARKARNAYASRVDVSDQAAALRESQ